jgi:small subunit ribosomal protein S1
MDRWAKDFSPRDRDSQGEPAPRRRDDRPRDDRPRRHEGGRPNREQRDAARAAAPAPTREAAAPPRAPLKPEPETFDSTPRTHLDNDDLMALAQMDPAELRSMMEGNLGRKRADIGSRVTGPVTRIGRDTVFLDLGGKSEGLLERDAVPNAKLGDELTAFVSEIDEDGIHLALQLSGRAASEHLEEARASGLPVEGKVTLRNAGGYEVRIGSARAFCPTSLMSRLPEVDMDAFVGQTLQFRVVETGEKLVVNRRVLQEEENEKKAEEVWRTIAVGQQLRGTVRSVQDFGFFVDLGGVDGLVPRREISWAGGADPRTAVRMGQSVEVVILEKDEARHKLTLSVKALESDPWSQVGVVFQEGGIFPGTVVKMETFGAFVELAPGLQGLVHLSKLAGKTLEAGTVLDVRLLSIDPDRRRLELSPAAAGDVATAAPDAKVTGTVLEVMKNGVLVQLTDGRQGWLPEQEADLPSGTVLAQRYRRGKSLEARIVKDDQRRPTLSVKKDLDDDERSWRSHQAQTMGAKAGGKDAAPSGFGTMAGLLGGLKLKK